MLGSHDDGCLSSIDVDCFVFVWKQSNLRFGLPLMMMLNCGEMKPETRGMQLIYSNVLVVYAAILTKMV